MTEDDADRVGEDAFYRVADALSGDDIQGDAQGGGDFWMLDNGGKLVTKEPSGDGSVYTVYAVAENVVEHQGQPAELLQTHDVDEVVEYLREEDE
jgi:hypothetical protein